MQKKSRPIFLDAKLSKAAKLRIQKWVATVKISHELDAFATKPLPKRRHRIPS